MVGKDTTTVLFNKLPFSCTPIGKIGTAKVLPKKTVHATMRVETKLSILNKISLES